MGGAYSALRGGDMGLLGNPAALGWQESYYVYLNGMYNQVTSDLSLEDYPLSRYLYKNSTEANVYSGLIGGAIPFEWGGIGLFYRYRDDQFGSTDFMMPAQAQDVDSDLERHQGTIGAGMKVMDQLSIGYRYSYIDWQSDTSINRTRPLPDAAPLFWFSEDFEGHNNHFGLQYILNDQWSFGLDGTYGFGDQEVNFMSVANGDGDPESWSVRGGASFQMLPDLPLLLALDVMYEEQDLEGNAYDKSLELFGVHLGAEYEVIEHFFLRAGYKFQDFDYEDSLAFTQYPGDLLYTIEESPSISGYSVGLGYTIGQFDIDYAFMFSDTGSSDDAAHYVGMGFSF